MEKYQVLVTRDITQSCSILINAASPEDAQMGAIACAKNDKSLVWENDDPLPQSAYEPYVTDCEKVVGSDQASAQTSKG